ncbi:hypothetical protein UY416_16050 [Paenibacillus polymyxa]|nr:MULTISPECIES: hypothetical protein [Paenibacillus]MCP3796542.1 hypothetical protein [Paenibacillus sp. CH40]MDY8047802.1 hypothetical protein [Paenibacillus polymyxa]
MSGLDDRYRGDGYAASGYRREQAPTGSEASGDASSQSKSDCWTPS